MYAGERALDVLSQELEEHGVERSERGEERRSGARREAMRREQVDERDECAQHEVVADGREHLEREVERVDQQTLSVDQRRGSQVVIEHPLHWRDPTALEHRGIERICLRALKREHEAPRSRLEPEELHHSQHC